MKKKSLFSCLKNIKISQNEDYFEDCVYYDCGDAANNNNNNIIKTDYEMDFGSNSSEDDDDDEEVFNTNFINSSSVANTNFSKSLNDIHMSEQIIPTRPNSLAISTADNFSCIDHAVSTFLFRKPPLTAAIASSFNISNVVRYFIISLISK